MPRDKVAIKAPVPWNQVVAWAGSEQRLVSGVKPRTWKWWFSEQKVPADRALPFALERMARLEAALSAAKIPEPAPEDPVAADPRYRHAVKDLRTIFTRGAQTAALDGIIENLNVFAFALDHGYRHKGGTQTTSPTPRPATTRLKESPPATDRQPSRAPRRRGIPAS